MTKLNQVVAIEKGVKAGATNELTQAYHILQKGALLSGISRTYQPRNDEGETLPSESTRVQINTRQIIDSVHKALARMFDVVATKDVANTTAKAAVVVDGNALIDPLPVSYLIFLEKQLVDIGTFIRKLPVLDPSDTWTYSDQAMAYVTAPVKTVRTKKIPRNHVLAEATDRHPAQVQVWHEDVTVGDWTTVKFSGAVPASTVMEMLDRVNRLTEAVKHAREEANGTSVIDIAVGDAILGYIFG